MFDGDLLDLAIKEIQDLAPDLVVVAGDLTSEGYAPQFRQAKRYLDRLSDFQMIVIPGNHDLMNVGFLHFRDAFGKSDSVVRIPFSGSDASSRRYATVVAINSSKPDLAEGDRAYALRLDKGVVRVAGRLPHLRAAPPLGIGPRDRARAQHRVGRR
ncbi:MAG: metallophosphoesterase [Actinomycetota bacterium]|nr:metallophosphoesterase [Actinomycetota bacterium]